MSMMPLEKREITNSCLVYGCMGLGGEWNVDQLTKEDYITAQKAVEAALENNITMFDHADIYKHGRSETVFGRLLKEDPGLRKKLVLQSKCGIRFSEGEVPNRYDFSEKHILSSVDGILERLETDYLDILLLHRPDPLMEPEEVAAAFSKLRESGKVKHFGVSNMNAAQIKLLQAYCDEPLIVNQLEMSLNRLDWVEHGVLVNQKEGASVNFSDGMVEHCRLENIQLQAWAPLAYGMYSGMEAKDTTKAILATKKAVNELAEKKGTAAEAIVLGWLMRHPAKVQPVIGTVNPGRIKNCAEAVKQAEIMTREEWYTLYTASRGKKMP